MARGDALSIDAFFPVRHFHNVERHAMPDDQKLQLDKTFREALRALTADAQPNEQGDDQPPPALSSASAAEKLAGSTWREHKLELIAAVEGG